MPFQYVTSLNRFRDSDTGRFVGVARILQYRDDLIAAGERAGDALASAYINGDMTSLEFTLALQDELKSTFLQTHILGRGGREAMTAKDYGQVGSALKPQYARIAEFKRALDADELSPAQIHARAQSYFSAAYAGYEQGNAEARGLPPLPAYPGDGSTCCVNGCHCYYRYVKLPGENNWDVYWTLMPGIENCETCVDRAAAWSPLQIRDGILLDYVEIQGCA